MAYKYTHKKKKKKEAKNDLKIGVNMRFDWFKRDSLHRKSKSLSHQHKRPWQKKEDNPYQESNDARFQLFGLYIENV
jgi:hypothetical protein